MLGGATPVVGVVFAGVCSWVSATATEGAGALSADVVLQLVLEAHCRMQTDSEDEVSKLWLTAVAASKPDPHVAWHNHY